MPDEDWRAYDAWELRRVALSMLRDMTDPDTGITHEQGDCDVCDLARAATRILQALEAT